MESQLKLSSSFYKLLIVGILLCMLFLAYQTKAPLGEIRTELDQPKTSNATTKIRKIIRTESVKVNEIRQENKALSSKRNAVYENLSLKGSEQVTSQNNNGAAKSNSDEKDTKKKLKNSNNTDNSDKSPKVKDRERHVSKKMVKYNKTRITNKISDKHDGYKKSKDTKYFKISDHTHNLKEKYIMHKLSNEYGTNMSAKQRASLVKERCKTFLKENNIRLSIGAKRKFDNESFLTSRRYNLAICYNCKVASTNTKRVLYALDNQFTDDVNKIKQHTAREYSITRRVNFQLLVPERRRIRVMLVREPLERLLSAYRDKRGYKDQFNDKSFSFKKYLQLILNENINRMNRHIYPYFERCRPCEMQFDYIGLQRNFDDDIKTVLKQVKAKGKVDIPKREKTGYKFASSDKLVKAYFKKIPNEMIHKLWEKYYKDYFIFGFPYPAHLMS